MEGEGSTREEAAEVGVPGTITSIFRLYLYLFIYYYLHCLLLNAV